MLWVIPMELEVLALLMLVLPFCFWIFLAYICVPNNGFIMTFFCIYMMHFDHTALYTLTFPLSPFFHSPPSTYNHLN